MTNGYWLGPDGRETEVHDSPPHTHAGWATEFLGGASDSDPVLALLKRGWVRVSSDIVGVWQMDEEKRRRIAGFVQGHAGYYQRNPVVFVEDESFGTTVRVDWRSLGRLRHRRPCCDGRAKDKHGRR
jgi:hypothetical protein